MSAKCGWWLSVGSGGETYTCEQCCAVCTALCSCSYNIVSHHRFPLSTAIKSFWLSVTVAHVGCLCRSWLENHLIHILLKMRDITQVKKHVDAHNSFYGVFNGAGCLHWSARYQHYVACGRLFCSSTRHTVLTGHKSCTFSTNFSSIILSTKTGWRDAEFSCIFRERVCVMYQYQRRWVVWLWWRAVPCGRRRWPWLWMGDRFFWGSCCL